MMAKKDTKTDHELGEDVIKQKNGGEQEYWRQAELIRLGFTEYQAAVLTMASGVYVSDIRESYLNKGCSHELVWRILEP